MILCIHVNYNNKIYYLKVFTNPPNIPKNNPPKPTITGYEKNIRGLKINKTNFKLIPNKLVYMIVNHVFIAILGKHINAIDVTDIAVTIP